MPEKKRIPRQTREELGGVSQSNGHLHNMSADELLTELEAKLDTMTDRSYDADVVGAYLAALDEKGPLQEAFDTDESWELFRSQHAILFEENTLLEPDRAISSTHKRRFRKILPRIIVAAIIAIMLGMFCAQAAGIDVFGAIGRWTEDTFRFSTSSESSFPPADVALPKSDGILSDTLHYDTLQEALDSHSITEHLVPTWFPGDYKAQYVDVITLSNQIVIEACYADESNNLVGISYTYWTDNSFEPSTIEKDETSIVEYEQGGITHYIMSNESVATITWINNTCECTLWGTLSYDELEKIIDSIYM